MTRKPLLKFKKKKMRKRTWPCKITKTWSEKCIDENRVNIIWKGNVHSLSNLKLKSKTRLYR